MTEHSGPHGTLHREHLRALGCVTEMSHTPSRSDRTWETRSTPPAAVQDPAGAFHSRCGAELRNSTTSLARNEGAALPVGINDRIKGRTGRMQWHARTLRSRPSAEMGRLGQLLRHLALALHRTNGQVMEFASVFRDTSRYRSLLCGSCDLGARVRAMTDSQEMR